MLQLEKVCEKVVESAVYSLSALNGKFVATIQNQTKIFELTKNNDLQADSPYTGNIIALYSDVSENGFILVGDLMRSLSGKFFFIFFNFCVISRLIFDLLKPLFGLCRVYKRYSNFQWAKILIPFVKVFAT